MSHVRLHCVSEYLVKAINEGWAKHWKENNWRINNHEQAENSDLWKKLLNLCEMHKVEFVLAKGHAENARCDVLSKNALKQVNLPPDEGFENRDNNDGCIEKITEEGQPCRKCYTPVVKRTPKRRNKTQAYYFEYYLYCPKCQTMYMVEKAKRSFDENASHLVAVRALDSAAKRAERDNAVPGNAGHAWSDNEDKELLAAFDSGTPAKEIALHHGRTQRAIAARLVRLGRIKDRAEVYDGAQPIVP